MENKKKESLNKKYKYSQYVKQKSPKPKYLKNSVWAFFVGGIICMFGQFIINTLKNMGLNQDEAATANAIILIFIGAFLTGLGIYDKLGKRAGGGSIIPITGFANSIVAPAMEFKREGYIFGIGAKMFILAGPVLVYGFTSSVIVGLIYFFLGK
ncbi:stage V sporulation protein AC [Crassaminicella thermophila]|uniref:Stage V sporulation protein AC n=1 Tax=Crassaminicella thermophila TaxID=2599308 RepID=A0A5C0SFA2_CRATE|nr:stage V sporulation protein AC [Crassaminicella thermophila]QEK12456.1 stage V sporulation protein AC [Crassaminicella thermophila]